MAVKMTVGDLLSIVKKRSTSKIPSFLNEQLNQSVVSFLKQSRELGLSVQEWSGKRMVICRKNKKRIGFILFDGRQVELSNCSKTIYIILNNNGALCKYGKNKPEYLPKHIWMSKRINAKPLSQLIFGCSDDNQPKDKTQTVAWLEANGVSNKININWCYYLYPITSRPKCVTWITPTLPSKDFCILLEAFTDENNQLAFREAYKSEILTKRQVRESLVHKREELLQETPIMGSLFLPPPNDPKSDNRSSSFSLKLQGLSEAYRLGAVTTEAELLHLSKQLNQCIPRVWFHLNAESEICHAALATLTSFKCFEIRPMCPNTGWKEFFDHVWKECETLQQTKQNLLQPVLSRFKECTNATGTRYWCYKSLLRVISTTMIHTFSNDDRVLHALKMPFAHYVCLTGKGSSIGLKTNSKRDIICLTSKNIFFQNISHLLQQAIPDGHPYEDEGIRLFEIASQWQKGLTLPPLPAKPVIDCNNKNPMAKMQIYIPGQIIRVNRFYQLEHHLEKRAQILLNILRETFSVMSAYLLETYKLDIASFPFQTLACLSLKCILLSFYSIGGPMAQSIEKTKMHYAKQIRQHARGGFSYSFADTLEHGQPLISNTDNRAAVSIQEFDVTSCYGFSACNMKAPGGFCVGYTKNEATGILERTDSLNRANTFEYKGCMLLLYALMEQNLPILSVYSNFSPLGIFYIGKYPIDLVIIVANETRDVLIIQYDGQFAHGCRTCPPLNRYVNDLSETEVLQRTDYRNQAITKWIDEATVTSGQKFTYYIITDCHHKDFVPTVMNHTFSITPRLSSLIAPYAKLPKQNLFLTDILNAHQDLTYILIGSGSIPPERRHSGLCRNGRLLIWKKQNDKWIQDFGWTSEDLLMFTRDTLENAVFNYGFCLDRIESCYFYRVCPVLPRVYQRLIDERINYSSLPAKSTFIKCIVNYSVGVMGYNPAKQTTYRNARITNKPFTALTSRYHNFVQVGSIDDSMYFLRQYFKPPNNREHSKPVNNALPIFASIVEFGKLRMQQIADFWDTYCLPGSVKICYSHIDNFVVAASALTIDDAVASDKRSDYENSKPSFVTNGQVPGTLKLIWSCNQPGWKFVSPSVCNYALVISDQDKRCKSSARLDINIAYQLQKNLLHGIHGNIQDTRRINKLAHTRLQTIDIIINPIVQ